MNYIRIDKDNMLNGEGVRVVLWVAGCAHKCKKCHNPETWNEANGIIFDENAKQQLFDELDKDYISGITFSGGDPLYCNNRLFTTKLAKEIKQKFPSKTIWLYTGYTLADIKDLDILQYIDVLIDGEYKDELHDEKLKWRGSANQNILHKNIDF